MLGAIFVGDQDTHHTVTVEFHDKSSRKGYNFADNSKYDMASLGKILQVLARLLAYGNT